MSEPGREREVREGRSLARRGPAEGLKFTRSDENEEIPNTLEKDSRSGRASREEEEGANATGSTLPNSGVLSDFEEDIE